ncbi:MAG: hypothetical protein NTV80_20140 [Verrucomicrobia bacterium]|nr:hypothetical protein [Verrucomicrobiota bacterium]
MSSLQAGASIGPDFSFAKEALIIWPGVEDKNAVQKTHYQSFSGWMGLDEGILSTKFDAF